MEFLSFRVFVIIRKVSGMDYNWKCSLASNRKIRDAIAICGLKTVRRDFHFVRTTTEKICCLKGKLL